MRGLGGEEVWGGVRGLGWVRRSGERCGEL